MSNVTAKQPSSMQIFKSKLNSKSVQEQFENALQEGAPLFVSSLIDIYGSDKALQGCEPNDVIMEALKAATLKLPINKNLGYAYIVPYKEKGKPKPQFQMGYRGFIQLAQRSGKYKYINADVVYEGELVKHCKVTGELDLSGEATSDKVIGYFAYIETVTGFRKTVYWPADKMHAHAKRYSKSFGSDSSPWKTNYDEMAIKTMLRNLLGKYGVMSIEMVQALSGDMSDERQPEIMANQEIDQHANTREFDIDAEIVEDETEEEAAEAKEVKQEPKQEAFKASGPNF